MSTNPATLRHRITIERFSITRDEYAQEIEVWRQVGTVWGEVKSKGVKELVIGGALTVNENFVISVRYPCDIQTNDRILHNGKYYAINGVADLDGTKKMLTLWATKGQAT